MSVDAIFRWWMVSIVDKATGKELRECIDAVLEKTTSSAIKLAASRNPLKPNESFSVSTVSGKNRDKCRQLNADRTAQIAQFTELMNS